MPKTQSVQLPVSSRRLTFTTHGKGLPTVILETGLGAESAEWETVQLEIGKLARVVRYDRANRGQSDPAPSMQQMHMVRIANGQGVEHWAVLDMPAMLRQFGLQTQN